MSKINQIVLSILMIICVVLGIYSFATRGENLEENNGSSSTGQSQTEQDTDSDTETDTDSNTDTDTDSDTDADSEAGTTPPYTVVGEYIYFGEYPQTIKASDVTVSTTVDSRGYYLGSDNEYYAKVTAKPCVSGYTFSDGTVITWGSEYYFKVEPIKWRIINQEDGTAFLMCDSVITNMAYDSSFSNYKDSDIRAWLNENFYSVAFTAVQREIIKTTTVDNGVESTGYTSNDFACEDTQDKVFLLSYQEVTSSTYGLSDHALRKMKTSDYSRATGAEIETSETAYGNNSWWLRSPTNTYEYGVRYVSKNGDVDFGGGAYSFERGVVPALQIYF